MTLALRAPTFLPDSLAAVLFENHLLWWIAVLALGTALILAARSRNNRQMLRAGQILLALTILWIVAARIIDTAAERLHDAHTGLAAAAEKADLEGILTYFAPNFSLDAGPVVIRPDTATADARTKIANTLKDMGIKDTKIVAYEVTLNPDHTASSRFTALTTSSMGPIKTTWQVSWDDLPNQDWKIHQASLLTIFDHPPGQL